MPIEHLNHGQSSALIAETVSTRNLLAYGVRVVRTNAFIETTRDPILTMLSIGMEKLYKLAIGLIELDREHSWPDVKQMKNWSHDLTPMHERVISELRLRTEGKSQYVRELVGGVDADPVVLPLIEALGIYGKRGRFFYLDRLGDEIQPVSPEASWEKIENAALSDPQFARLRPPDSDLAVHDADAWDQCLSALNDRIAATIERVWVMAAGCGINRALGATGVVFGSEVHPDAVGRQ